MAEQSEARAVLIDAIATVAKDGAEYGGPSGAAMVRDAAYAYRALIGGAQPGNVVVEK